MEIEDSISWTNIKIHVGTFRFIVLKTANPANESICLSDQKQTMYCLGDEILTRSAEFAKRKNKS